MPTRQRAPARRTPARQSPRKSPRKSVRKPAARKPSARKPPRAKTWPRVMPNRAYAYSPELLAHGRRLYEETDTPATEIAADFGIDKSTLSRLAKRERWVRHAPAPRGLPPRLSSTLPPRSGGEGHFTLQEQGEVGWGAFPPAMTPPPTPDPSPPLASLAAGGEVDVLAVAAHLRRAIADGILLLDRQRAEALARPDGVLAGARIAQTLASLTATLDRLARIERETPVKPQGYQHDDYDMPADIDEFRLAFARRIEALAESDDPTEDDEDADGAGAACTAAAANGTPPAPAQEPPPATPDAAPADDRERGPRIRSTWDGPIAPPFRR